MPPEAEFSAGTQSPTGPSHACARMFGQRDCRRCGGCGLVHGALFASQAALLGCAAERDDPLKDAVTEMGFQLDQTAQLTAPTAALALGVPALAAAVVVAAARLASQQTRAAAAWPLAVAAFIAADRANDRLGCMMRGQGDAPDPTAAPLLPPRPPPAPAAAVTLPLSTQARWIVDAAGRRVKLACVNWAGADQRDFVAGGLDRQPVERVAALVTGFGSACHGPFR